MSNFLFKVKIIPGLNFKNFVFKFNQPTIRNINYINDMIVIHVKAYFDKRIICFIFLLDF